MSVQARDAKFRIKGDLNVFNQTGDIQDASSLTSFHAGAVAEFKVSENFSIQPELLYSIQGAESKTSFTESIGGIQHRIMKKIKLN